MLAWICPGVNEIRLHLSISNSRVEGESLIFKLFKKMVLKE